MLIKNKILILGVDLNINLLKMYNHVPTCDFLTILMARFVYPIVTKPTRITKYSATLIGNIFVTGLFHNIRKSVIFDDISDHFPILLHLKLTAKVTSQIVNPVKRFINPINSTKFKEAICQIDWSVFITKCSYNGVSSNELFFSEFLEIF